VDAALAYSAAVKADPDGRASHPKIDQTIEPALQAGKDAVAGGRWEAAIPPLQAALVLDPDLVEAHFALGNAHFNLGNAAAARSDDNSALQSYSLAQTDYQAVLDIDPQYAPALTNLGVVAYQTGDLDQAISLFQQALAIEPEDTETIYLLGAAYLNQDRRDEARAQFERAIELDPELAPAHIGLGNIHLLDKDYERAVAALQRALELAPDSPEALFALGKTYAAMGRCDDAVPAFQQFLQLNPIQTFADEAQRLLQGCANP
jgi:superkiller protein 3